MQQANAGMAHDETECYVRRQCRRC